MSTDVAGRVPTQETIDRKEKTSQTQGRRNIFDGFVFFGAKTV